MSGASNTVPHLSAGDDSPAMKILQAARAAGVRVDMGYWTGTTAQIHAFVDAVARIALRDQFAGMAMQGMMTRDSFDAGQATPAQRASLAYIEADAMLAARQSIPAESRDQMLAALEAAYAKFGDYRFEWPGRSSARGQALLVSLREAIAAATGRDPREVQDDYGTRAARAEVAA